MFESGRRYYLGRSNSVAGIGGEEWARVVALQVFPPFPSHDTIINLHPSASHTPSHPPTPRPFLSPSRSSSHRPSAPRAPTHSTVSPTKASFCGRGTTRTSSLVLTPRARRSAWVWGARGGRLWGASRLAGRTTWVRAGSPCGGTSALMRCPPSLSPFFPYYIYNA